MQVLKTTLEIKKKQDYSVLDVWEKKINAEQLCSYDQDLKD